MRNGKVSPPRRNEEAGERKFYFYERRHQALGWPIHAAMWGFNLSM
jgi:hypothetical protein